MNPQVVDMVNDYLKRNGYDGLFNPDGECACRVDDLEPCGDISGACTAGYFHPVKCGCNSCQECDPTTWHICAEKFNAGKMDHALDCFTRKWRNAHGKLPSAAAVQVAKQTFEQLASEGVMNHEKC